MMNSTTLTTGTSLEDGLGYPIAAPILTLDYTDNPGPFLYWSYMNRTHGVNLALDNLNTITKAAIKKFLENNSTVKEIDIDFESLNTLAKIAIIRNGNNITSIYLNEGKDKVIPTVIELVKNLLENRYKKIQLKIQFTNFDNKHISNSNSGTIFNRKANNRKQLD